MADLTQKALAERLAKLDRSEEEPPGPVSPPDPVYLVHGEEMLLVEECRDAIREAVRKAHGEVEREVLRIDRFSDKSELRLGASNLSLFGDVRHIEVVLLPPPDAKAGQALAEIVPSLKKGGDHFTICVPGMDWRGARKLKWFQELASHCVSVSVPKVTTSSLPGWVAARLKANKRSLTREAMEFFVQMTEGNLLAANQEILKLCLLFPEGELGLDLVREGLMDLSRFDSFAFQKVVRTGNGTKVARVLRNMRQEDAPPPLVLWALADEARALLALKEGRPVWGERKSVLQPIARALPRERILEVLKYAERADLRIKGQDDMPGDPWDGLLSVAAKLHSALQAGR